MDLAQEQVEAVDATSVDDELAYDLKRKLWLKIAEHVIEKEHNLSLSDSSLLLLDRPNRWLLSR